MARKRILLLKPDGSNHLPRNEKATVIYQRNVREQFKGHANPFRAASARMRARAMGAFVQDVTPTDAVALGYKDDPWICGPAIYFEGWTCEEVAEAEEE